jgi:hypothetical protein
MPVTNPASARIIVYNVVVTWVGNAVGIPGNKVDVSRTFTDPPSGGYGFDEGRYLQMCDEITGTISVAAGRSLKLPGNWRLQHEHDAIQNFIDATAIRLMAASMTPTGVRAHEYTMGVNS